MRKAFGTLIFALAILCILMAVRKSEGSQPHSGIDRTYENCPAQVKRLASRMLDSYITPVPLHLRTTRDQLSTTVAVGALPATEVFGGNRIETLDAIAACLSMREGVSFEAQEEWSDLVARAAVTHEKPLFTAVFDREEETEQFVASDSHGHGPSRFNHKGGVTELSVGITSDNGGRSDIPRSLKRTGAASSVGFSLNAPKSVGLRVERREAIGAGGTDQTLASMSGAKRVSEKFDFISTMGVVDSSRNGAVQKAVFAQAGIVYDARNFPIPGVITMMVDGTKKTSPEDGDISDGVSVGVRFDNSVQLGRKLRLDTNVGFWHNSSGGSSPKPGARKGIVAQIGQHVDLHLSNNLHLFGGLQNTFQGGVNIGATFEVRYSF